MWLGEMYWNPARPPRDAVSIEILQKMGKMLESVDNFERRCPSEFFLLPLSILKVLQDNFFFLWEMMLMVLAIVFVMPFGINLIKDPRLYKTASI